jgi:hypothetical protein
LELFGERIGIWNRLHQIWGKLSLDRLYEVLVFFLQWIGVLDQF